MAENACIEGYNSVRTFYYTKTANETQLTNLDRPPVTKNAAKNPHEANQGQTKPKFTENGKPNTYSSLSGV